MAAEPPPPGGEGLSDGSGSGTGGRRRQWMESRRRKEPSLYDEWLDSQHQPLPSSSSQPQTPRRGSMPLRPRGSETSAPNSTNNSNPAAQLSASTIRSVTPGHSGDESNGRSSPSFERFHHVSPPARSKTPSVPTSPASPPASSKRRLLVKSSRKGKEREREQGKESVNWERAAHLQSHSPPSSRNGSAVVNDLTPKGGRGHTKRASTLGGGDRMERRLAAEEAVLNRPRTRTLDDSRSGHSPSSQIRNHRHRMGSVNLTSSTSTAMDGMPVPSAAAAQMTRRSSASVIEGQQPQRHQHPPTTSEPRPSSPDDRDNSQARRILHLMRTLRGRMQGTVSLRRHADQPWTSMNCWIHEEAGALLYGPRGSERAPKTLVADLRGCAVRPRVDGETPYLALTVGPRAGAGSGSGSGAEQHEFHLKPASQAEFDAWYAAFMHWLDRDEMGDSPAEAEAAPVQSVQPLREEEVVPAVEKRPALPPRTSSRGKVEGQGEALRSDRRKSVVSSLKEAPVIKIGKMIYWESSVESGPVAIAAQNNGSGRPVARRAQSIRSRKWRRISGQLRENGELKLHADADNSLMSVVQLSQLSRCAIQRLDPSVLDVNFCIAIYPQYTSDPPDTQRNLIRPIFLGLENRVLYEVWFVLLRAFTIPQLYGPRMPTSEDAENGGEGQDLEDLLTRSTMDMFRMERTLHIRVIEAKMHPSTGPNGTEQGSGSGHSRGGAKSEQYGFHAEVLLDSATRGKTSVKFEGLSPLWGESFEFLDLPPVLNSASVVIKRRPAEQHVSDRVNSQDTRRGNEPFSSAADQHGGFTGFTSDVACGKVEIYLEELEEGDGTDKWWPVLNSSHQRVGEVLIRAQAEEGVILMARDYEPLAELLHRFSNGLTLHIIQTVPNELKRISDCLLNIFQVSGRVGDWLMSLIEEEIDGIHKETPGTRLRYSRRVGSDVNTDLGTAGITSERELIVRDMNRNATVEANLLFRGNTLLTKALDSHMRRVGKEYLEASLATKLKEINDKDPDCEVDPNRVPNQQDLDRNWRRLLLFTQEIWTSICNARRLCPIELRLLFKHIRACAEDRYGDFLRSVSFSSVSGFLFLRFFCPAILNPSLFGLLNDEIKPRARRTFVLIAKSLQTLANLASFGTKETWMEPMNAFLTQHRESFKGFINDICYAPRPVKASTATDTQSSSFSANIVSADTHLSYTTPMTIMQRLPPTSREGFPSLPYLIDQARAYAELVQVWLEATNKTGAAAESSSPAQSAVQILSAIKSADGDLLRFHETCTSLNERTQECLSRAERAERPSSGASFQWDEMIDQLQPDSTRELEMDDLHGESSAAAVARPFNEFAERMAGGGDEAVAPPLQRNMTTSSDLRTWRPQTADSSSDYASAEASTTAPSQSAQPQQPPTSSSSALELLNQVVRERPWSAGRSAAALRDSLRKAARSHSRGSACSPSRDRSRRDQQPQSQQQHRRPFSSSANTSTGNLSSEPPSSDTDRPGSASAAARLGGKKGFALHGSAASTNAAGNGNGNGFHQLRRDTRQLRAQRREAMVVGSESNVPLSASPADGQFDGAGGEVQDFTAAAGTGGAIGGKKSGSATGARKKTPIVSALRKTRQKEQLFAQQQQQAQQQAEAEARVQAQALTLAEQQQQQQQQQQQDSASGGANGSNGANQGAYNGRPVRGVDMSFL